MSNKTFENANGLFAQSVVLKAAEPVAPGESIKAQQRRAADRLKEGGLLNPDGKVRRAWYGLVGAKVRLEIEHAFSRWQASLASRHRAVDDELAAHIAQLEAFANASSDPEHCRPLIEAFRAYFLASRPSSGEGGGGA